jgi:hypothetical protein
MITFDSDAGRILRNMIADARPQYAGSYTMATWRIIRPGGTVRDLTALDRQRLKARIRARTAGGDSGPDGGAA